MANETASLPAAPGRRGWLISRFLPAAVAAALAAGCSAPPAPAGAGRPAAPPSTGEMPAPGGLLVVTSLYPLHDLARRVADPSDSVLLLAPPGVEPHDWEPSPRQAALVRQADVLLTGGLEPWLSRSRRTLPPSVRLLDARAVLAKGGGDPSSEPPPAEPRSSLAGDPHWWLDPLSAEAVARAVADTLAAARPETAAAYRQRAALLAIRLRELDRRYRQGLARCRRRVIVTSHAAFGHLAARYGLHQVPVAGLTPADEPGPRRLAETAALIRREGITTIFVEPIAPAAAARALASETGAHLAPLHPLEGLTPAEARAGADYFSIMEDNLRRLRSALECR